MLALSKKTTGHDKINHTKSQQVTEVIHLFLPNMSASATAFLCQERIEVGGFTLAAGPELHASKQEHTTQ